MFKFIHAADIHLDSPLRGLERYDGAPVERIRLAARRALENLVQLALSERVAFVVIAGDLYDGDWRDYNTGLYLVSQMARLRDAEIPVFVIAGNHDAHNTMTRTLRLPGNVHLFAPDSAQTQVLERWGVAIHGQSYATSAIKEDLSRGYPAARKGLFNLGLLHTCYDGREGHEPYAPCTLDGLRGKSYDYWALGHIHKRELLHQAAPIVVFPGNVQGRHIRETGPKGCMLVTVREGHPRCQLEFRALDVLRWERVEYSAAKAESATTVLDEIGAALRRLHRQSDGRPLAVRVDVAGASPAHEPLMARRQHWINEIRALALDIDADTLWIEKVNLRTTPHLSALARGTDGPLGELTTLLDEWTQNQGAMQEVTRDLRELTELARKIPGEMQHGDECVRPADPAWLKGMLAQVGPLLTSRLLGREVG